MRYLPLTPEDRALMLAAVGARHIDELFADAPVSARLSGPVDLPFHQGEIEVERELSGLAAMNRPAGSGPFFCGAGAYRHHVPASVDHIIQRSEFLTSYTPYQPEIAQGTLQYLFEFQTQVAALTGMEVANASMYDGSTACAEAVMMAARVTGRDKAVLSGGLHPHYAASAETLAHVSGIETVRMAPAVDGEAAVIEAIGPDVACVVVQTPNVFGQASDLSAIAEAAHAQGALMIVVTTEAVSYGLLKSPGDMGADIAVAEGQSIGNGLNFGGPYVGLFAAREKFIRQMPGRLAGETVDAEGRRGFVLTLSTREQHIRREKATSNICTNSGLCALAFTTHMSLLGDTGLRRLALLNHQKARKLRDALLTVPGVQSPTTRFFNEFALRLPVPAAPVVEALAARGVLAGIPYSRLDPTAGLDDVLLVAATETVTDADIDTFARTLREVVA
jgi:glycine dehydrogenase subunit 1